MPHMRAAVMQNMLMVSSFPAVNSLKPSSVLILLSFSRKGIFEPSAVKSPISPS